MDATRPNEPNEPTGPVDPEATWKVVVEAIFPDGARVSAPGWVELEDALMDDEWNPHTTRAFRREMRDRAKAWSGRTIRKDVDSESFLRKLEGAGMLRLEVEGAMR